MIRVLVIHGDRGFCKTLRGAIDETPGARLLHVVAEAWDGETAIRYFRAHTPDAVVVDISMEEPLGGMRLIEAMKFERPAAVVVGVHESCDPAAADEALRVGADAVMPRCDYIDTLRAALTQSEPKGQVYS